MRRRKPTLGNPILDVQNEQEISGFSFYWPYICLKGYGNKVLIHNVNENKQLFLFDLPEDLKGIPCSFITEKYELFIIGDSGDSFILYFLNLDGFEDASEKD